MPFSKIKIVRGSPIPIYEQIAQAIRNLIAQGRFAPGEKLPGIKVLAKIFGVNHLTLRQALRRLEKERVVCTESARGTYVVGGNSKALRVAFLLPNLNETSSLISAGAQRELAQSDSTIDILHYNEDPMMECEQLVRIDSGDYDGALMFPSMDPRPLRHILTMALNGFPIVFMDRFPQEIPLWTVQADNFRGGFLAAEHLIKAGCKRIACLMHDIGGVRERYMGWQEAMGRHALPIDYDLVYRTAAPSQKEVGAVLHAWMRSKRPPEGVFFVNDLLAIHGLSVLREMGVRVPQTVKVVGFDDLKIASLSNPALTTVRQNFEEVGRMSAHLLVEQVKIPPMERLQDKHALVPVELIARQSSAASPA